MISTAILSTTYFGPIQWYQKLNRYNSCLVERHENFIRQTYRNRCIIATAQGLQSLSVPVEVDGDMTLTKTPVKDVRISDHGNWRHLHWHALMSAYGESPFFDYYADDLRPFFERKWKYLIDFNTEITQKMCQLLDIQPHVSFTERYLGPQQYGSLTILSLVFDDMRRHAGIHEHNNPQTQSLYHDFREVIRPKHPVDDESWKPRPYYQVFREKFGFQPNLSILDLLFNEGNEAVMYL